MSPDQVMIELKDKRLPTFGTAQERKDRLKKNYGIINNSVPAVNDSCFKDGTNNPLQKQGSCLEEIEKLKIKREERRQKMEDLRKNKTER